MGPIATITNLGFAVTSTWDPVGITAAQADITKLTTQLAALTDHVATVKVIADTATATADIDALQAQLEGRVATVQVAVDPASAEAQMDAAVAKMDGKIVTVTVDANTAPAEEQLAGFNAKNQAAAATSGAAISKVGMVAGAAVAGGFYEAVKSASTFQTSLMHLQTDANETHDNLVNKIGPGLLQMSADTGTGVTNLSDAIYHLESSGYHGQDALTAMTAAAEGAKVGGADLETTTQALARVMYAMHDPASQATGDMNEMIKATSLGDTRLNDLAGAMGTLLPAGDAAGVSLNQLLGGMAVMTANGQDAASAATHFRQTILQLSNPTAKARAEMSDLGLNYLQVAADMKDPNKGLPSVFTQFEDAIRNKLGPGGDVYIQTLQKASKSNDGFLQAMNALPPTVQTQIGALADMTGGTKSLQAVLQMTGKNLGTFKDDINQIGSVAHTTSTDVDNWSTVQATFGQKTDIAKASLKDMAVTLGTSMLPTLGTMVDGLKDAAQWLTQNKAVLDILVGTLAAVAGAWVTYKVAIMASKVAQDLWSGATALGTAAMYIYNTAIGETMLALYAQEAATKVAAAAQWLFNVAMDANPVVLIGIAIVALVAGIVYLATQTKFFQAAWRDCWQWCKDAFNAFVDFFKTAFDDVWKWIKDTWDSWVKTFQDDWAAFWTSVQLVWDTLVQWFKDTWTLVWTTIKVIWDTLSKIISDAWGDYWAAIRFVWDTLTKWFTDTWTALWTTIKVIWDTLSQVISDAWGIFWDSIKTVASTIWDAIKQAFTDFGNALNTGLQGIVKMAGDVWNGIKKIFADPLNVVIGFYNSTVGDIINKKMTPVTLASGGVVPGDGAPRADDVPAMLSSKEFVVNAADSQKNLAALHHANSGGTIIALANGGQADGTPPAVQKALDWAGSKNGQPYNADGWIDCSGLASGIYDSLMGVAPKREFTTVSDFVQLGFNSGTGGMMEIGVLPKPGNEGHMAVTLAGHNIESAGQGKGIQVDGSAWGASNPYFTDHYYLPGNMFKPQYSGPGDNGTTGKAGPANGIMGVIGSAIGVVRNAASSLFKTLTDPILAAIPKVPGVGDPYNTFPKGLLTSGRDDLLTLIKGHESSSGSSTPIGGVIPTGQHLDMIDQALALTSTPPPGSKGAWEAGMNTLITRESGWNSAAQNNTDANAAAGIPSKGLAQTIDPTFNANAVPGHTDIWDPVSNIAASINYIKRNPAYGDISNVQQANANMPPKGYASGTMNAVAGLAWVGENGPELVNFKGGEEVTPLSQVNMQTAPPLPTDNAVVSSTGTMTLAQFDAQQKSQAAAFKTQQDQAKAKGDPTQTKAQFDAQQKAKADTFKQQQDAAKQQFIASENQQKTADKNEATATKAQTAQEKKQAAADKAANKKPAATSDGNETQTTTNKAYNASGDKVGKSTQTNVPGSVNTQTSDKASTDPNDVLAQTGDKANTAIQAFGQANANQALTDLGGSTSGTGFVPELFTQSFKYGQQLAANMQNHVGIFGNQSDTTGKNAPTPANTGSTGQKTVQGPTDVHFHTVDVGAALKQWTQQVKTQSMGFNPFGAM